MAKLLFSDIDGTLINSKLEVTAKTKEAIRRQIINGNVFIPVSARMPQAIMTPAGQIMKTCPMIAYNGALVLDEMGRPLCSKYMTAKQATEICTYVEEKQNQTTWSVYSGYDWYYFPGNNSDLIKQEEQIVKVKAKTSSITQIQELKGVHKVLLLGNPEQLTEEQKELSSKYPELVIVKSAPNLLEIMVKDVSKGEGVKILAEEFNVDLKNCWAFGDNYNDEPMLKVVGHPIIMGNAPADLKRHFTDVTSDNNHDGIAEVLDHLE